MQGFIVNWKTTVTGLVLVLLGGSQAVFGFHLPGFTMEPGAAIIMGLGFLAAKDGNVTGGTVPQTGEASTRVPFANAAMLVFAVGIALMLTPNNARAADMLVKANVPAPIVRDWSGFFIGVNGASVISKSNVAVDPNLPAADPGQSKGGTPYGGAAIGLNIQKQNFVVGLTLDLGWLNAIAHVPCGDTSCIARTTYSGDALARVGLTMGSMEFLTPAQSPNTRDVWVYGLGGAMMRGLRAENAMEQVKATKVSFLVGAGAEVPIGANLSGAIEWHHVLPAHLKGDPTIETKTNEDRWVARLNYRM